jgi:ankyrin repeat protein
VGLFERYKSLISKDLILIERFKSLSKQYTLNIERNKTNSPDINLYAAALNICSNDDNYYLQQYAEALKQGANINCKFEKGNSVIHLFAEFTDMKILNLTNYIVNKFDLSLVNDDGNTIFHILSLKGSEVILSDLLQYLKVPLSILEIRNNAGYTALQLAVKNGKDEVAEILLKNGVNTTSLTSNSENLLHLAAHYTAVNQHAMHTPALFQVLINYKINLQAVDNQDNTPLSILFSNYNRYP